MNSDVDETLKKSISQCRVGLTKRACLLLIKPRPPCTEGGRSPSPAGILHQSTALMLLKALLLLVLIHVCLIVGVKMSTPRVRREIRALSNDERSEVFAAMLIMKRLPTTDGRQRYGPAYINYDDLVVKHNDAASDSRCDQGHLGPGFAIFHRAFVLIFEESLLSINPAIGALPYWDYNVDSSDGRDPRASIIWTDEWFGSSVGDPNDGYSVKDGVFSRNGYCIGLYLYLFLLYFQQRLICIYK
jgi:hypothetical protein